MRNRAALLALATIATACANPFAPDPFRCGEWSRPLPFIGGTPGTTVTEYVRACFTPEQATAGGWSPVHRNTTR